MGANLTGASLVNADLTDVRLRLANLSGADLTGADLTTYQFELGGRTLSLVRARLLEACGDANTKLPAGLTVPPCRDRE